MSAAAILFKMATRSMAAEFDKGGYPTEGSLDKILGFEGTPRQLIDYVEELWWGLPKEGFGLEVQSGSDRKRDYYRLSIVTSGWSGNESVITELETTMFWFRYWQTSRRGGGYTFHIAQEEMDAPTFLGDLKHYAESQRRETAGPDHL